MNKIKGANSILVWVLIIGVLAYTGVLANILGNFGGESISLPVSGGKSSSDIKVCGDDGLADIRVRYRNGASTTAVDYRAQAVRLIDADKGDVLTAYTPNSDGTYAATANALECGKNYYVVVLNSPSGVAAKSDIKNVASSVVEFDVTGANSSQIAGNMYSLSFANETLTGTAFATGSQDFATVTNNALGTGDSITIRFDIKTSNSSAQFGAVERICETDTGACGRAFACFTGASGTYALDDLSMSAPFVVAKSTVLPKLCATSTPSNAGVGRVAFELNAITSAAGSQSGTYSVKSGLANAANTENVRIIYMDNAYYQSSTGKLKVGTSNDAQTDTGDTNRYMEIDIT